jgi:hypothetical protein
MAVIGRQNSKWYLASQQAMSPSATARFNRANSRALADRSASSPATLTAVHWKCGAPQGVAGSSPVPSAVLSRWSTTAVVAQAQSGSPLRAARLRALWLQIGASRSVKAQTEVSGVGCRKSAVGVAQQHVGVTLVRASRVRQDGLSNTTHRWGRRVLCFR